MKIHLWTQAQRRLMHIGIVSLVALGCGLAALGFALVLDVLSLRELSAHVSPAPLERLIVGARARVHHTGAQWGEFLAGLFGLLLVVAGARLHASARQ